MTPETSPHPIWMIDDDPEDHEIMEMVLEKLNPSVSLRAFLSGTEFLEVLSQNPPLPKLILLDLNMPVLNGFEILSEVRQHNLNPNIPIVVFTTSSDLNDEQRAFKLGANGFVTKPVHYSDLKKITQLFVKQWL